MPGENFTSGGDVVTKSPVEVEKDGFDSVQRHEDSKNFLNTKDTKFTKVGGPISE